MLDWAFFQWAIAGVTISTLFGAAAGDYFTRWVRSGVNAIRPQHNHDLENLLSAAFARRRSEPTRSM
jgi:hypothetical protein